MHPVPLIAKQILSDWEQELSEHLCRSVEEIRREGLGTSDFPTNESLHIKLADGSFMQLEYAFHVVNVEKFAIAIFTEHCGYFILPFHEAVISRIKREVLYVQDSSQSF